MKRLAMILASTLLAAAPLAAQQPAPTAPPAPEQQAAMQNAPGLVLIFPFKQMGDTDRSAWLSAGMQEYMAAELSKTGWVTVKAMPDAMTSSDSAKAIAEGKDAGAVAVLFGSYQVSGMEVRVTGQLVQIATGNVMSVIQVTGSSQDVFKVEDQVGNQLEAAAAQNFGPKTATPANPQLPAVTSNAPSAQAAPSVIYPAPQVVVESPPEVYVAPNYDYGYDNYGYGYPYAYGYYPPVIGFGFYGGIGVNHGFRGYGHSFNGRLGGLGHFGGRIGGGFHVGGGIGGGFHGGGFAGHR